MWHCTKNFIAMHNIDTIFYYGALARRRAPPATYSVDVPGNLAAGRAKEVTLFHPPVAKDTLPHGY